MTIILNFLAIWIGKSAQSFGDLGCQKVSDLFSLFYLKINHVSTKFVGFHSRVKTVPDGRAKSLRFQC